MKKYEVFIVKSDYRVIVVEAESPEIADEIAWENIEFGAVIESVEPVESTTHVFIKGEVK
jgi:hypothetical protein